MSGAPNFDMANARSTIADLATATPGEHDVVLNFGALQAADGAVSAALVKRISLSPRAARRLQTVLQQLIADAEQGGSRP